MQSLNLMEIYWGNDSAENDENLMKYFINVNSYFHLEKKRKNLIIGRKGSGKSAIRKKMYSHFKENGELCVDVFPTSSLYSDLLDVKSSDNVNKSIFFKDAWKLFLLERIACEITEADDKDLKVLLAIRSFKKDNDLNEALTYMKNIAKSTDTVPENRFKEIVNHLKNIDVNIFESGYKYSDKDPKININKLEKMVALLVSKNLKINIFMDNIDNGWNKTTDSEFILTGMLLALEDINSLHKDINYFAFLRTDMYNLIVNGNNVTQSDKFRDIYKIVWDQEKLISMLIERIKYNFKEFEIDVSDKSDDELFLSVFPDSVGKTKTKKWLCMRTLNRPRELLHLSRLYTEKSSAVPNSENLKSIEQRYSEEKLNDLSNEYGIVYQDLGKVLDSLKTRTRGNNYLYSKEEFENLIRDILSECNSEVWKAKSVTEAMMILFEINLIGEYVTGGVEGGSREIYESSVSNHEPQFNKVIIHPCFREALQTKQRNR